ncbi:unnamed protein product [Pipistrellus nathusii]|uniref:Phospholipid hydroperoxide glutathione peroxidase, mitochondrial n=1 Tax=Pipistrellus nathusii TaxID=59473 RepID=A0ABP0A5C9_PIPNA
MGGQARRRASIGQLGEGRSCCLRGAPAAAEMSFSRLCRLLKPALLCGALAVPGVASTMCASRDDWRCAQSMHDFSAKDIDGRMVNLDKYRGFVCIVTNVASQ